MFVLKQPSGKINTLSFDYITTDRFLEFGNVTIDWFKLYLFFQASIVSLRNSSEYT